MNHENMVQLLSILKAIGEIFMFSVLKTLFSKTYEVTSEQRRNALIVIMCVILLTAIGICRNGYTLGTKHDWSSLSWMTEHLIELTFLVAFYTIVYLKCVLSPKLKKYALILVTMFFTASLINIILNCQIMTTEPFIIFVFWTIVNIICMVFSYCVIYCFLKKWNKSVG